MKSIKKSLLEQITSQIAYLKLLNELSELNEQLIHLDGDNQLKDAELFLKGLGFEQQELNKPVL